MYNELTSRVLIGGFVSRSVNADFLVRSGVTHLVYASDFPLSPIIRDQFWTLELANANRDGEQKPMYWPHVFSFTREALRKRDNKLYFHVTPEIATRPDSPVAAYAALRVLGYSRILSRHKLEEVRPIVTWHEQAMAFVDRALTLWCQEHNIRIRCVKEHKPAVLPEDDLDAVLDEAAEWVH